MLKKTFLFVLFFRSFAIIFASESQNGAAGNDFRNEMLAPYEFNSNDLASCTTKPGIDKNAEYEPQGIAHVEDNDYKQWFLSVKRGLKVYRGFFDRNNEKELLWNKNCAIGASCYLYADHLGDLDFDSETKTLYIPLEKLKLDNDLSGYSIYKWIDLNRSLQFEKLVVLEPERGGSSAPYAAYNSIDHLVYLHGYDDNTGVSDCKRNRICGYNPNTAAENNARSYLRDIPQEIVKEENRKANLEQTLSYLRNQTEITRNILGIEGEILNESCSNTDSKEICEERLEDRILSSNDRLQFLRSGETYPIYTTSTPEKVIVMMAECGSSGTHVLERNATDRYHFQIYDGRNEYCEVSHYKDSNFTKQGAIFSPNNRFLFYVHGNDSVGVLDESKNRIHVYYFPDSERAKFYDNNLTEPIFAIFAGTIFHKVHPLYGEELEGVDIWSGEIDNFERCDLHELMTDNDPYKDGYYIFHWRFKDTDGDGITDLFDKCIFTASTDGNNDDSDGDGFGDVCDNAPKIFNPDQNDIDGDGIPNDVDKCPYFPHQYNIDFYYCKDNDKDRVCDETSVSCREKYDNNEDGMTPDMQVAIYDAEEEDDSYSYFQYNKVNYLIITKDDVKRNFIDNCEFYNPFVPENSEIMFGVDPNPNAANDAVGAWVLSSKMNSLGRPIVNAYKAYNSYYWQPDHDLDGFADACEQVATWHSKVENVESCRKEETDPNVNNEYLAIDLGMYGSNVYNTWLESREQSLRYCSLPLDEEHEEAWGTDGFCTMTEKSTDYRRLDKERGYKFSHGSEPKPKNGYKDSWQELTWFNHFICMVFAENLQNMRSPWDEPVVDFDFLEKICAETRFPKANSEEPSRIYWNWRHDFYSEWGDVYADKLYPQTPPEGINISHFKYTLSVGVKGTEDEYLLENDQINTNHFYNDHRYARSRRWYDRTIGYYTWKWISPIPIAPERMLYFDEWLRQAHLREGLIDPEKEWNQFDKWIGDWKDSIISVPIYIDGMSAALAEKDGFLFALDKDAETGALMLKVNHVENSVGWMDLKSFGILSFYSPAGLCLSDEREFLLLKNDRSGMHSLFYTEEETLYEIQGVPTLSDYAFIKYGTHVYLTGNSNGYLEMYEIVATENEYLLNHVESVQKPSARTLFNSYSDESGIYLAGGGNTDGQTIEAKRDIWKFDAENGWQIVNADTGKEFFNVFIRRNGDELLIVDMESLKGNVADYMIVDLSTGMITEEGVVQIGGMFDSGSGRTCVETDSNYFWAGLDMNGFCSKFTDPYYSDFNAGTEIYAVDGFAHYMFAAYSDGVKAYDISDPTNPVLKNSISLYGPVRDLKVVKTRIFAATGNGIDVLNFNGSQILLEKHIQTYGNSAVLKKYGNYLIIGDGQGLKKLDLESLEIVQQVNTSGEVTTLIVQNGTIHLYGYSGLKRYNAETFEQIQTSYSYKSNPKLSLTLDNKIIVSYGGKVYELTYSGNTPVYTQKSGSVVEMNEGYAYSGYGYFPQGSTIRIAAMTAITLPVCGNGNVEIGEICDGNSVECSAINPDYVSGTAICNSTCSGYSESNCSTSDGWF